MASTALGPLLVGAAHDLSDGSYESAMRTFALTMLVFVFIAPCLVAPRVRRQVAIRGNCASSEAPSGQGDTLSSAMQGRQQELSEKANSSPRE